MTQLQFYFKSSKAWRSWLEKNHKSSSGVYLIFYKVSSDQPSMRWEEAVKVALCFGWIDSKVRRLDTERREQYFSPRKSTSVWSKLNKSYIEKLISSDLMHASGLKIIHIAQENGSWNALNDVDNEVIPEKLKKAFESNPQAFTNFKSFAPSYRRSYLYWLHSAKRDATKGKRISEIIRLCHANIKQPSGSL